MARVNAPFLRFNSGLISPESLARVDDPRTQLSAEVMTNWLPKTQGSMRIRPGTKYVGSSLNDTGAYYIEFVAASDELALVELTHKKMRVLAGSDAHALAFVSRPNVATTLSITDTGWTTDHIGGGFKTAQGVDQIPALNASGTKHGIEISTGYSHGDTGVTTGGWKVADDNPDTYYLQGSGTVGWIKVDFGTGNTKRIKSVGIKAPTDDNWIYAPFTVSLEGNSSDSDTGGWTREIDSASILFNGPGDYREVTDTGYTDTGANAWQFWRLFVHQTRDGTSSFTFGDDLAIAEMELFEDKTDTGQSFFAGGKAVLNAGSIGGIARIAKNVQVDTGDRNTEHSLSIDIQRGPVTLRVGSLSNTDDLIAETDLATGSHNLAFIPTLSSFHVSLQSDQQIDKIISNVSIGDTGTIELDAPWNAIDLDNIRFDQSADVVFVNASEVKQHRIERRGTDESKGRSWSVVEYVPDFGPFRSTAGQHARLDINGYYGNAELTSDIAVFQPGHVGTLFRITHSGQSSKYKLGESDAATEAVSVVGINDTGKNDSDSERVASFAVSGTYSGTIQIERSFESPDFGFSPAIEDNITDTGKNASDTGTFTVNIRDVDDNLTVYYRARMIDYNGGTAVVAVTNKSGVKSGTVRCTRYNSNESVNVEIVRPPSDTGLTVDWEEGAWSDFRGFPSSVALHEGRLAHAGEASVWLSTSDDYTNFDDEGTGDAGPIARTFGSGPVQDILNLVSSDLLIAGTADSEMAVRSSSFDEILTPSNTAARRISTLGSANVRAIKRNRDVFFVQRSGKNLFRLVGSSRAEESEPLDLTVLAPDVLASGVVSMAIQREPDTRIHCVLADGTVAILTYEPNEEMIAWSKWAGDTGTGAAVERAMVLPGTTEDAVYYHVRRTINGTTKRYLEKWALEEESIGDTGLSYLADCAKSFTGDTGDLRDSAITGFQHLAGASVVVWADDTGQATAGKDLSPDVSGVQTEYAVGTGATTDTGEITLSEPVHHAVAGLPYRADWKSTKLAYGAQAGTALAQLKRTDKIGFVLYRTHNNGLFFGNDTGQLDPLSRKIDGGATVDVDKIFTDADLVAMPFPGLWSSDSRIYLRGKSPRPVTVLAAVPTVQTNEKL